MRIRRLVLCSGAIACSLFLGRPSPAQVAPPAPHPTIWNFLGIPSTTEKLRNQVLNRRGNRPGLEKKPPLKAIGDPANLMAPNLPIRTAAEIKQQEDLKLQKIKGIKYLASVGCGCYDKEGKVTAAMLAAMNDCTEEVRLAAVESIAVAATSERCVACKQKSCCNEAITEQLVKLAYQYDDKGCFVEPSERVREAAAATLQVCCPGGHPPITPTTETEEKVEGADEEKVEGAEGDTVPRPLEDTAPPPPKLDTTLLRPLPQGKSSPQPASSRRGQAARTASTERDVIGSSLNSNFHDSVSMFASNRLSESDDSIGPPPDIRAEAPPAPVEDVTPKRTVQVINVSASMPSPATPPAARVHSTGPIAGVVENVDTKNGVVHLHLEEGRQLPVGTQIRVLHELVAGFGKETDLEVMQSAPGMANARLKFSGKPAVIARGDRIVSIR